MNSRGPPPGRGRGGGRGYVSRGRGYYSGGGRYSNHRGRGDYGGRGGRYIPRGGGGGRTPRIGSYSSIGRGGGGDGRDHGTLLDRNRDNDGSVNPRVGSYADLASSIPSYSDIGRSIGGNQGERGGGFEIPNNNNNSSSSRDDVGMSSYAQLGEMTQPTPSLGMKRSRPMDSNTYADDNNMMGPRGGGGGAGPPPSYRGHNNRDDGMARGGPQLPHNDFRQPPDMQDKRSSLSHQPTPADDQFGRRGDWRIESHEDQFGRQLPTKRTSVGYGRGPPGRGHPRFVPDASRADNMQLRQESLSPPPRRESGYQRFEGPRPSSQDATMPSYASIADKTIPQPAEEHPMQQQENSKKDDAITEVVKQDEGRVVESKRRSMTPPPVKSPVAVVVVPPSPKSPSPAPPSAYALAMSRMVEMNADMEFAWVRMQFLDTEVKLIEARLESME